MDYPSETNYYYVQHADALRQSFKHLLGRDLLTGLGIHGSFAEALFFSPMVVLSHDNNADPLFNYANLAALQLFGYAWDEMIGLPSRLSAEVDIRSERQQLLTKALANGFIEHYQGVRVDKAGNRFLIKNAVIWTIVDGDQRCIGQAACFNEYHFLEQ